MNRLRILLQLTGASRFPVKYAVVFEICRERYSALADEKYECYMNQHQSVNHRLSILSKGDFSFCELRRLMTPVVYKKLVSATGLYQTLRSERIAWQSALFGTNFSSVYQGGQPDNFEDEWFFIVRKWDEDLSESVRIDEPYTVLYDADATPLPEAIRSEKTEGARYVLRQEGPAWTIIYGDKVLRGLKAKGLRAMQFLVKNPRKQFSASEVLTGIGESPPQNAATGNKLLGPDNIALEGYTVTSTPHTGSDLADKRARREIGDEWRRLEREADEAAANNDLARAENARQRLENFRRLAADYVARGGKSRKFPADLRKINNMVRRRIHRALRAIGKYDATVERHFRNSLRPISGPFSYNPSSDLPWTTE